MNIKQATRTIMAVAIMCIACPSATHAQFGLKNVVRNAKEKAGDKVRRTINDGVEKGINSVVDDAERRVTNAVIGLKQDEVDDGDRVLVKTKEQPYDKYTVYRSKKFVDSDDYSEVAPNYLYYLLRTKQAATKGKNDDEMCTYFYELDKYHKMLQKAATTRGEDGLELLSGDMKNELVAVIKMVYKQMFGNKGFPDDADGKTTDGLYKKLNWVVDKALKSKSQAVRRFYYDFAYPNYYVAVGKLFNDSDKNAKKLYEGLTKLYETTPDYRKDSDQEPLMPNAEAERKAKVKAEREAKIAAEKKAQEDQAAAERAARTRAMPTAGMKNATLTAQCLKLAKSNYADWNPTQAIIKSTNWQIDRQNGSIVRRRITVYLICNEDGQKVARTVSFQQPYTGGGRYGSLQTFGVGVEWFYIK